MKKSRLLSPACALFLSASMVSNAAFAVLIDFDNLPGGGSTVAGQILTNEYAFWGVTFSAFEDGASVNNTVGLDFTLSNPMGNSLSNSDPFSSSRHDVLRISFSVPVNNLQWLTRRSYEAPTFNFYNAAGDLLGSLTSEIGSCCTLVQTDATAFSNVSRIDAIQPTDTWFWVMDNLSFDPTVVPAPPALWLFSSGLLGLVGLARRKLAT